MNSTAIDGNPTDASAVTFVSSAIPVKATLLVWLDFEGRVFVVVVAVVIIIVVIIVV